MRDFDPLLDEGHEPDFEISEETRAKLKRAIQDCNDGFTYEMLQDDDGLLKDKDGKLRWEVKCNKCGRIGNMREKPFPHKLHCPMKERVEN